VLLTLLFLSEWAGMDDASVLDTSYNLTCEGIEPSETDIVAIAYGARPETHTHLLIGECKGRGHVTEEDVRKLTAVATKLRETDGVECDVVFSTTRDAFTEDELTLFRRYYESSSEWEPLRRAPILLTARQLDFGRHSGAEDGPTLEEDRGPGFAPLVTWSTRKLTEAAPATEVEI
jgi:hypothetical protein